MFCSSATSFANVHEFAKGGDVAGPHRAKHVLARRQGKREPAEGVRRGHGQRRAQREHAHPIQRLPAIVLDDAVKLDD